MGRPRSKPDSVVLEAASRVFSRLGPTQLTLAHVAEEAGLAPATLIQRFGSKRGLLAAMTRSAAESIGGCFDQARAGRRSPLRALFAALDMTARLAETPEALANSLGFLAAELADPELRRWTLLSARTTLKGYEALLEDAVQAGELEQCDTKRLARLVQATAQGSLISWACFQKGASRRWIRRDVETLLKPYRTAQRPSGG